MRNLFSLDSDGTVVALPHVWLLLPFKAIQDKYKSQEIATVELGLVWFSADYRSNFMNVTEIHERVSTVKKNVYANRKLKIDETTYKAIEFYIEEQNKIAKIAVLRAINSGLSKATSTLEKNTMEDLDDIKTFAAIATSLPGMVEKLTELEKAVRKENMTDDSVVGTQQKGTYEDDI